MYKVTITLISLLLFISGCATTTQMTVRYVEPQTNIDMEVTTIIHH